MGRGASAMAHIRIRGPRKAVRSLPDRGMKRREGAPFSFLRIPADCCAGEADAP